MQKYGYLSAGSSNSEALHTEESITDAIMQMQLFGGLQQTGILNEDTLKVKVNKYKVYKIKTINAAYVITQMWQ